MQARMDGPEAVDPTDPPNPGPQDPNPNSLRRRCTLRVQYYILLAVLVAALITVIALGVF